MVHFFPLEDHFICLDTKTDRVRIANEVAAAMLKYHEAGYDRDDIAKRIESEYDVPLSLALSDAEKFLETLHEGLELSYEPNESYVPLTDFKPCRVFKPVATASYHLPHFSFDFRSESRAVLAMLAHYSLLLPNESGVTNSYPIEIYAEDNSWPIVYEGKTLDTGLTIGDTVVKAIREINVLAARHFEWVALFHAAAVVKDGKGLLFPAVGGSGKTTLSAYLMAHGYSLLNDDVVSLLKGSTKLLPAPLPLSIKQGSWDLLAPYFPLLETLEPFGSFERKIKYLPPENSHVAIEPVDCAAIVLPAYSPSCSAASIEPVSAVEVCSHIIEGGCFMDSPLEPDKIGTLISWLDQTPCYRIHYNYLDSAHGELENLLDQLPLRTLSPS